MAVPGTTGKVLWVDLASGESRVERPDDEVYLKYVGGYGLGVYFLYRNQAAGVDPLGPGNTLGFFAGLLTGTPGITSNRFIAVAKSPKTGGWGDANCGGSFGPALKTAGYDGLLLTGQCERPSYLLVKDGRAELHPAEDLWGLEANATEDRLRERHGKDVRVASIGPAGERLSLLAAIIHDKGRAAARSGLGAVMGSKRLKAVVLADGVKQTPIADPEGMKEAIARHREFLKTTSRWEPMRTYGTAGALAGLTAKGDTPVKNWAGTAERDFPQATKISDDAVVRYERKKYACWRCPMACGGLMQIDEGPFACEAHKPEYETLGAFGTMCLNDDVESIIHANELCNRLGLDTIGTGCTVAFALECFDRGLITPEDTGGLALRWGDAAAIVELTRRIGLREGIGDLLADGTRRAAERLGRGAEEFAIHVGGEELPMHDPRLVPSAATTYQMDATPGRHTQVGSWILELSSGVPGLTEQPQPQHYTPDKAYHHARMNNYFHVAHTAGMCMFALLALAPEVVTDSLTHVTGRTWTLDEVLETGRRIATLRIAFNLREGLRNVEIPFPGRALGDPPLEHGPSAGRTVELARQNRDYLAEMGWDPATGVPKRETLEELGLGFVVGDLAAANL